jgi:hypothetical protein
MRGDGVFGVRRLGAAFRLKEKRRQAAALQRLPPFHVKKLISRGFNLHTLQFT